MKEIESYRKSLNKQQTELSRILLGFRQHPKAIELFLRQHALLHSARMAETEPWLFEDEIVNDLAEEQIRRIPRNGDHSIAWLIWHMARIEDVTMNLLVAGRPQVLHQDSWLKRMGMTVCDTGNAMDAKGAADLSATIDIRALRAYRLAVGRRTREIVKQLEPNELRQRVEPHRLQQVLVEGAVVEAASGLIDYWGKRTIAGLLLMPATRHNIVHMNEAWRIRQKRQ